MAPESRAGAGAVKARAGSADISGMDPFWRFFRAVRKRFALAVIVMVLAGGARVGWDAARLWVFGTPATIPTQTKRAAALDSMRSKAIADPLVLDGAAPIELQLPA